MIFLAQTVATLIIIYFKFSSCYWLTLIPAYPLSRFLSSLLGLCLVWVYVYHFDSPLRVMFPCTSMPFLCLCYCIIAFHHTFISIPSFSSILHLTPIISNPVCATWRYLFRISQITTDHPYFPYFSIIHILHATFPIQNFTPFVDNCDSLYT